MANDMSQAAAGAVRTIKSVLATVPFKPHDIDRLRRAFAPAEFIHCLPTDSATIEKALQTVDVAVLAGDLDDRHVAAPNLKWVHCDHSGLTRSARADVFDKGLIVTGSAGRSAPALAQHAFYFALALTFDAKRLFETRTRMCGAAFPVTWTSLGSPARRSASWGSAIPASKWPRSARPSDEGHRLYPQPARNARQRRQAALCRRGDSLDPLLEESDVIMLATQLTDVTYHMFSTDQFARMKPSAFIINMARGPVIDEAALLKALTSGQIAGAGLDVFAKEPLPADSPLWDAPNAIITPHATPRLPDKTQRSIDTIVGQYRALQRGTAHAQRDQPERTSSRRAEERVPTR